MWSKGEHVLMRYGPPGGFRTVRPLTVVRDDDDFLVAWLAPGTPVIRPVLADGREIRSVPLEQRFRHERKGVPGRWRGPGILKVIPRDGPYSVWLFWRRDGRFRGWYVNLEQRHLRWSRGLDTRDHVLDVWVPRRRRWEWKDEDELAAAVAHGAITDALAEEVRADGRRVTELVERWARPFSDGWERFRPDPSWPLPDLPDAWSLPPDDPAWRMTA